MVFYFACDKEICSLCSGALQRAQQEPPSPPMAPQPKLAPDPTGMGAVTGAISFLPVWNTPEHCLLPLGPICGLTWLSPKQGPRGQWPNLPRSPGQARLRCTCPLLPAVPFLENGCPSFPAKALDGERTPPSPGNPHVSCLPLSQHPLPFRSLLQKHQLQTLVGLLFLHRSGSPPGTSCPRHEGSRTVYRLGQTLSDGGGTQ